MSESKCLHGLDAIYKCAVCGNRVAEEIIFALATKRNLDDFGDECIIVDR